MKYAYGLGRPCEVCHHTDNGEFMVLAGVCPAGHTHGLCPDCYRPLGLEFTTEEVEYEDGTIDYWKWWLSCPDAARVAHELMAEDES